MLIINAVIHSMHEDPIDNGYILINNGKISKLGPMSQLFADDKDILDVKGNIVIPGLVDAHSHIGIFEDGLDFEGNDCNEDTDPSTPHLRAIDAVNPLDNSFKEALSAGITTVITGPGSTNPIGGQMVAMKTFGKRIDDMIIKNPVSMKFSLGENPKATYNEKNVSPVTRMAIAAIIRENLAKTADYKAARADNSEESGSEFDFKCESLLSLIEKKLPVHFHAHRADDIFTAIRIAKEFDINYVLLHCTDGSLICDELAKEKAKVILGPLLSDRSKPELKNLSTKTPYDLYKNGILFAIASDHPELPAKYLLLSVAIAVRDGLPYDEGIKAVTINAAKICGIADRVGSIEPGKDADIIVFDKNPLDIMAKINYVIINGNIAVNNLK